LSFFKNTQLVDQHRRDWLGRAEWDDGHIRSRRFVACQLYSSDSVDPGHCRNISVPSRALRQKIVCQAMDSWKEEHDK
jgi:hypothetical protein